MWIQIQPYMSSNSRCSFQQKQYHHQYLFILWTEYQTQIKFNPPEQKAKVIRMED